MPTSTPNQKPYSSLIIQRRLRKTLWSLQIFVLPYCLFITVWLSKTLKKPNQDGVKMTIRTTNAKKNLLLQKSHHNPPHAPPEDLPFIDYTVEPLYNEHAL